MAGAPNRAKSRSQPQGSGTTARVSMRRPPTATVRMLSAVPMPCLSIALVLMLLCAAAPAVQKSTPKDPVRADGLREAGWLQSIRLQPHGVRVTAKLDTGAKSSAIHAVEVERFERNGVKRVRFSLYKNHAEQSGTKLTYDLPVAGTVRIKRGFGKPVDERVIVRLSFCIDGEVMDGRFSLVNRANRNYPVLLGREFLKDHFVVNAAKTFVFPYGCPSDKGGN